MTEPLQPDLPTAPAEAPAPQTAATGEPAPPLPASGVSPPQEAQPAVHPAIAQRRSKRAARPGLSASLQSLVSTVVIAVFVITFIAQAFQIPSKSMENTLLIGDYLLVDKVHFGAVGNWGGVLPYRPVERGDIVVFRWPPHPQQHFVKRVVGLPGDRVRIHRKQVYVNGRAIDEEYVVFNQPQADPFRDNFPTEGFAPHVDSGWWMKLRDVVRECRRDGDPHPCEMTVPDDQYFVLGDNRDDSLDSRYWGLVPRENIVGRPLLIYWSLHLPDEAAPDELPGGKLRNFAYVLTHLHQFTRWDRTFRLIK